MKSEEERISIGEIENWHCIVIQALPFFCKTENPIFSPLLQQANPKVVMIGR